MRKIKLDYNLCVFLFAYLNQAELSLHRAGCTSIGELKRFYSIQVNPRDVINLLMLNTNINADELQYNYVIKEYCIRKRQILSLIHFSFRLSTVFQKKELIYICQKLKRFAEMLEKDEVHRLEMEELRIDLSKFSGRLMYKISYKNYLKALNIEHYMQHDRIEDIKITEFMRKLPDSCSLGVF